MFDIDSLFVIRKDAAEKGTTIREVLGEAAKQISIKEELLDVSINADYTTTFKDYVAAMNGIINKLKEAKKKLRENTEIDKVERAKTLRDLDSATLRMIEIYKPMLTNEIVERFGKIIRYEKNKKATLEPISMDRFSGASNSGELSSFQIAAKINAARQGVTLGEYPTSDEINQWVKPQGVETSPDTTERTQQNVYAGSDLTGIGATFAKVVSYTMTSSRTLFEELEENKAKNEKDKTENFLSSLNEKRREVFEKIMEAKGAVLISEQSTVRLNDQLFDRFRSNELKKDGSAGADTFMTLDAFINAAIDNVKEQILYAVNLNSNNANMFLTGVALGIPLNSLTILFKTAQLEAWKSIPFYKLVKEGYPIHTILSEGSKKDPFLVAKSYKQPLNIDLDKVLRGEALSAAEERDIAILYVKLQTIGSDMRSRATFIKPLVDTPASTWDLRKTTEAVFSYVDSSTDDLVPNDLRIQYEAKVRNSDDYKSFIEELEDEENGIDSEEINSRVEDFVQEKVNEIIAGDIFESDSEVNFNNRVISKNTMLTVLGDNKVVLPSTSGAILNSPLLNVPNIYSMYRSLILLQRMLEKSIVFENPQIVAIIKSVFSTTGTFESSSDEARNRVLAQNLFFRFITSNMDVAVPKGSAVTVIDLHEGNDKITIKLPVGKGETENRELLGFDAWRNKFISTQLREIRNDAELNDGPFIRSLRYDTDDDTGVKSVGLAADKVNDEAIMAAIQDDLVRIDTILRNRETKESGQPVVVSSFLANLFKYEVLEGGLAFSPNSLAMVFPKHLFEAYSKAINIRVSDIINSYNTFRSRANSEVLKNYFTLYWLKKNFGKLTSLFGDTIEAVNPKFMLEGTEMTSNFSIVRSKAPRFAKLTYGNKDYLVYKVAQTKATDTEKAKAYYNILTADVTKFDVNALEFPISLDFIAGGLSTIKPMLIEKGGAPTLSSALLSRASVGDLFYALSEDLRTIHVYSTTSEGVETERKIKGSTSKVYLTTLKLVDKVSTVDEATLSKVNRLRALSPTTSVVRGVDLTNAATAELRNKDNRLVKVNPSKNILIFWKGSADFVYDRLASLLVKNKSNLAYLNSVELLSMALDKRDGVFFVDTTDETTFESGLNEIKRRFKGGSVLIVEQSTNPLSSDQNNSIDSLITKLSGQDLFFSATEDSSISSIDDILSIPEVQQQTETPCKQ